MLTQIPRRLFAREAERLGLARVSDDADLLGVGMFFLPHVGPQRGRRSEALVEASLASSGLRLLGWRDVPIDPDQLGAAARSTLPRIRQALIVPRRPSATPTASNSALYLARKDIERARRAAGLTATASTSLSLSSRTLVYKGLFAAHQLPAFYPDLRDPDYQSGLAVYHQRYSTNTFPTWQLAQPFRLLAHNGEINTLLGNRAWMQAREARLPAERATGHLDRGLGLDQPRRSAAPARTRRPQRAARAERADARRPGRATRACRRRCRTSTATTRRSSSRGTGRPALAFSDGRYVGAALDRNGLRPCRYKVTAEGLVVAGSEVGAIELDDYRIVEKGRLGPGQMLALDLERHADPARRTSSSASSRPNGRGASWIASHRAADAGRHRSA